MKLRRLTKLRGLTTATLARELGMSSGTLENVRCGSSTSRRARQQLTDFFRTEIWEGIRPRKLQLGFRRGDKIEFSTATEAKEQAKNFPRPVMRRGKVLIFTEPYSYPAPPFASDSRGRIVLEQNFESAEATGTQQQQS